MKVVTKNDLAKMLAGEKRFALNRKQAIDIVETLCDLIVCSFQSGAEKVVIRGFGTFRRYTRKGFVGSHPQTGAPLRVYSTDLISFKPAAETTRRIN